jgi:hypothetical protein
MSAHIWNTKYRWNQKLITQFYCTLRDEHFEPNYSKFGQLLPTKNKKCTVNLHSVFGADFGI